VLYTGLTRDGTFLIENGKVSKSIKNLRFNESPLFMLNNLDAPVGRAVRVGGVATCDGCSVRDFTTEPGGDVNGDADGAQAPRPDFNSRACRIRRHCLDA
jgi:hypothetical protein